MRISTRNDNLLKRSRAAVWHPCTQMKQHETLPLVPDRARQRRAGCTISTAGAISTRSARGGSICSAMRNPHINAALPTQLGKLEHVMLAGFTHEPVVELSERLSALTGGALGHCFYGSDGASAVEIALKMSFHYWRNRGRAGENRLRQPRRTATTARRWARCRSPTSHCSGTPMRRCCGERPGAEPRLAAAEPGESPRAYAERCAARARTLSRSSTTRRPPR